MGRTRWIWTPELDRKFREIYPTLPDRLVAKELGISASVVKSRASNARIRKAPGYNRMAHNVNALRPDEVEFIRWTYYSLNIDVIANLLGRGESSVQKVVRALGLPRKPNSGCIKKGNRPHNFRKKSPGLSAGRMRETQFKKGHEPKNSLRDGAITIRYDHPKTRAGRAYKWIRISKGKWIHYHRYLWEQANGPVPAKHVVIFIDGDSLNCDISNLKLISMAENAARNYDPIKGTRAARDLTDNYIAGRLAGRGNKKLRHALIVHTPELIEAKRIQLQLKRTIKNERDNKTRKTA